MDELESVLQQRYQQHERLYLQSIQFNGWDPGRGLVHFGPVVVARSADDLQSVLDGSPQILDGKGAYHCTTQAIVVLSLGPP